MLVNNFVDHKLVYQRFFVYICNQNNMEDNETSFYLWNVSRR